MGGDGHDTTVVAVRDGGRAGRWEMAVGGAGGDGIAIRLISGGRLRGARVGDGWRGEAAGATRMVGGEDEDDVNEITRKSHRVASLRIRFRGA